MKAFTFIVALALIAAALFTVTPASVPLAPASPERSAPVLDMTPAGEKAPALLIVSASLPWLLVGMVGAGTVKEIVDNLHPKHLVVGVAILFCSAWVLSRLLPGAAARAGIRPRPLLDAQMSLPEPFGLMNVKNYLPGSVNALLPGGTASSLPLAQTVSSITANAETAISNTVNDSLQSVTGGASGPNG